MIWKTSEMPLGSIHPFVNVSSETVGGVKFNSYKMNKYRFSLSDKCEIHIVAIKIKRGPIKHIYLAFYTSFVLLSIGGFNASKQSLLPIIFKRIDDIPEMLSL